MLSAQFIHWLDGYLGNVSPGMDLNAEKTQKIRVRLNSVFKHEIDPVEDKGRNPEELRKLHAGEGRSAFDPPHEMRDMC